MAIPKQRGPGQTGGYGGHRANRGTFRNSGGSVPPKKTGCFSVVLIGAALTAIQWGSYVSLLL